MAAAAAGNRKKRPAENDNIGEEINWKTHVFTVGEKLSFIAVPECVWNEVEVVEIITTAGKQRQMKVRYFGWHLEYDWFKYDEWLTLDDEMYHRFAVNGTGVHRVKCFVNLGPGLQHWPCFALIRQPATVHAKAELKKYNHVYVEVTVVNIHYHFPLPYRFVLSLYLSSSLSVAKRPTNTSTGSPPFSTYLKVFMSNTRKTMKPK